MIRDQWIHDEKHAYASYFDKDGVHYHPLLLHLEVLGGGNLKVLSPWLNIAVKEFKLTNLLKWMIPGIRTVGKMNSQKQMYANFQHEATQKLVTKWIVHVTDPKRKKRKLEKLLETAARQKKGRVGGCAKDLEVALAAAMDAALVQEDIPFHCVQSARTLLNSITAIVKHQNNAERRLVIYQHESECSDVAVGPE
jgi:hypothetical protein